MGRVIELTNRPREQSFECVLCQQVHYACEAIYIEHRNGQSKHGITWRVHEHPRWTEAR